MTSPAIAAAVHYAVGGLVQSLLVAVVVRHFVAHLRREREAARKHAEDLKIDLVDVLMHLARDQVDAAGKLARATIELRSALADQRKSFRNELESQTAVNRTLMRDVLANADGVIKALDAHADAQHEMARAHRSLGGVADAVRELTGRMPWPLDLQLSAGPKACGKPCPSKETPAPPPSPDDEMIRRAKDFLRAGKPFDATPPTIPPMTPIPAGGIRACTVIAGDKSITIPTAEVGTLEIKDPPE